MLLKRGSSGDDVKKLQTKLGLKSDGDFGPITENSVKNWQQQNGLTPNGIVDDNMWDKLFEHKSMNLESLRGVIPNNVLNMIPDVMNKFEINTPLRLSHFLSQCSHESGNFTVTEENLNYNAKRLKEVFPRYFPNNLSESYARQPQKIGSRVYGGRMGNGVESTGEGFKFRGRGYIQLTGKDNYTSFGRSINEDMVSNPDLVSTKYPLLSAAWFFHVNNINQISDGGASDDVIKKVTKKVNGGYNGLDDRTEKFKKFYELLK